MTGHLSKIRNKVYRQSKHLYTDVSQGLGWNDHHYRNSKGARIIIYHGVCKTDHLRFNPIFVTYKMLEAHFKFYKKHFNVITLNDFYQQRFAADRYNICLTFDDGFANNYHYVFPLLEKYQLPATFFITAITDAGYDILWNDFLGIVSKYGPANLYYNNQQYYKGKFNKYYSASTGNSLAEILRSSGFKDKAEMMDLLYPLVPFKTRPAELDYWQQMTPQQIRLLAKSPFATIGAHGYYHNDLARINLNDAVNELKRSKAYLENLVQQPVESLAFPYGSYNTNVVEAAKKTGYRQLLAMDFNLKADESDPAMRERFTVNPLISTPNQMRAILKGKYIL